ncbi:MerR family transcriptional regulator [uncultured Xylophilus sp.]|uniref:MerR family transcriptional regulator n=1 Tax=uncultured Xylophilus sp. TaxID=296832 RepID=UPI0025F49641|nr:MerR family transcriptional regulator [uncultured Xylophilus sp.]
MGLPLPSIPAKRYFTIGEVAELCDVKPHVLRYWEQEFTQLRPMKRRGNRRYYQHHEVLMIRRIRDLLYEQGFTISGARNKLQEWIQEGRSGRAGVVPGSLNPDHEAADGDVDTVEDGASDRPSIALQDSADASTLHRELLEIRALLTI